jgi:hypothetical protein
MNFLGNLFLHVSHGLVDRILASGAGGLGLDPGGVKCGIEEEGLWKLWLMHGVTKVWGKNRITLIIFSQKCHLYLLKFQKVFVDI